ncbi:hypothetical protein FALCPG4_015845 [Fusarium falciforme]
MSNRKRSRSIAEENREEFPFTISYANSLSRAEQERHKKRKREGQDDDGGVQIQMSPFSPTGTFKTHETMDLYYTVEPGKKWQDMKRYNSFVRKYPRESVLKNLGLIIGFLAVNGIKYYSEGFVYVANETTLERQKAAHGGTTGVLNKSEDDWVARILEIRASDEHHVYARVYWMYWPDELPPGTLDGKKQVQGRQPYHGANELIASNHMDVINVVSVTQTAKVNQWIESDDEEIQDALYWRQAYDCRNSQLSSVDLMCKCQTPANPDKMVIGCVNEECGKWLHRECLTHEILMQVYERLGTDKPHRTERTIVKEKTNEEAMRPLSPTEAEEMDTQPTIDVHSGETQRNVYVEKPTHETARNTETPTPGPAPSRGTVQISAMSSAKKGRKKKTMDYKPYQGLFEANLKMNEGPTFWEIRDLRENVTEGEKAWTEKAYCLMCNAVIS